MADVPKTSRGPSFVDIYKKGQGYYTRLGTGIGGAILILGLGNFIYEQINFNDNWAPGLWIKTGVPVAVIVGMLLLLHWLVDVKRSSCDFLIATDGEMKKVNWTSKKEIIAATKVVILVTILTALALFLVDQAFKNFFIAIDVLQM